MKSKHILWLAMALGVLVAARIALHVRQSKTASHPGQAGLGRVLDSEIDAASVRWIRVSGPAVAGEAAPSTPLELVRTAEGWSLVSAESAPADAVAVEDFLSRAVALEGEIRGEGEAAWPRFGVDPVAAVKVELGGEPHQALATLWLGKTGDAPDAHFVRAEGSTLIRHCREGLRGPLGLWSEGASPAPDQFLKKGIVELESKDIRRVSVERPDAAFTLERGEGDPPAWTIAAPELPWVKQADALDGVVSRAARVRVTRVLPPGTAACDAAPGAGSVTFTRDAGEPVVVRLGSPVEGGDDLALRAGASGPCYAFASFGIANLLPRASALWSIPQVFFEMAQAEPPSRLRYQRGRESLDLVRSQEGDWSLAGGGGDAGRCARLANAFRELRIDDVAELARVPPEALAVEATLSAQMGGRSVKLHVLGERIGNPGERYVRVEGGTSMPAGWVAVLAASSVEALLPSADELRGSAGGDSGSGAGP